jgi:transposase
VRVQREEWQAEQASLDPKHLIFIDETGVTTAMARRYGWGPRGERVVGTVPQGHWQTTMLVAALRLDGFTAPRVTVGPLNGDLFLSYVREFLGPTLKPGDQVIWDNLSVHQVRGVREAIEARGASLKLLPPYSPDFNPIEQAFSKLKAWLRKVGRRTTETLWESIGEALTHLTPAECANYFVTQAIPYKRSETALVPLG